MFSSTYMGPWWVVMNLSFNHITLKCIDRTDFPEIVWPWCFKTWTIQSSRKKSAKINWGLAESCTGWMNMGFLISNFQGSKNSNIAALAIICLITSYWANSHLEQAHCDFCFGFYVWTKHLFSLLGNKQSELKAPIGLKQQKQSNFKRTLKTHFSSVSGHNMWVIIKLIN